MQVIDSVQIMKLIYCTLFLCLFSKNVFSNYCNNSGISFIFFLKLILDFGMENALINISKKGWETMKQIKATINSESGLHARPASTLVKEAMKFKSEIKLLKNDKEYNLKSLIGILSAEVVSGEVISLKISGEDQDEAANRIKIVLEKELAFL